MKHFLIFFLVFSYSTASAESPKRVVSIGGAITEIIYALKAGDKLVGNDTTSYYPPEAEQLPKVGYMRSLSAEGILSLNPDLVILTEEAGPLTVLEQLKQTRVPVLKLNAVHSISGIKLNIQKIAAALEVTPAAETVLKKIDLEMANLQQALSKSKSPMRVMFILQHGGGAPLVAGTSTAADSMITLSGGINAVHDYTGYKPLTPEAAITMAPDFLLITNRGIAQAGGLQSFQKSPGISLTEAAKNGRIIVMDALLLLGFGPRTPDAALQLHNMYGTF